MNHRKYAFRFALIIILAWAIVWLAVHFLNPTGS